MSAAALPFEDESPWRDTSRLQGVPTAAEVAASPPSDPAARAGHDRYLATLLTQRAWQARADEDDLMDALYQAHVDQAFIERAEHDRDWPPAGSEPEAWS
jgi:hypothetical protein